MPRARRRRWPWRLLVGGRVLAAMKRSLGAGEWVRRGLGVAVLAAVVAIALGLDTGFLTRLSLASTTALEQGLLTDCHPRGSSATTGGSLSMMPAKSAGEKPSGENAGLAGRRPIAVARRRGRVAELAAADAEASRQSRGHRFLDLFVHQLSARDSLRSRLGGQVQGPGAGGDRRACAGIRLREATSTT